MNGLRLTIGIPTLGNRPERLSKAIASALAQTVPARVLVSDQDPDASRDVRESFAGHPLVRFVESPAKSLWANWCFAVESCDTEVFSWLQDDDVVAPHFARRALSCLDACPGASVYLARLGIAYSGDLANWWQATGPFVPMDLMRGLPATMNAAVLAAGAYFTSHALSPAVAFRWSPEVCRAVRRVPDNADLFAERSVLTELAKLGMAVCDPAIVGYWIHHADNESRKQNQARDGDRQFRVMLGHVDGVVPEIPGWKDAMAAWFMVLGRGACDDFRSRADRFRNDSPVLAEALDVLDDVHPPRPDPPAAQGPAPERAVSRKAARAERRTA